MNSTCSDCQMSWHWEYISDFGSKFSWNEGIDTCFNIEFVSLGRNFEFLGGYLVVTARYLMVTTRYCSLLGGYCWLLLVIGGYSSFSLVPTFSMNDLCSVNISWFDIWPSYHREKSRVISWVEEEHKIRSSKATFKQAMSEKFSSFQSLKKLLILIAPTSIHVETFAGCDSGWSVLKNEWLNQKDWLTNIDWRSLCHSQILNSCIPRLVKMENLWQKFRLPRIFAVHLNLLQRLWKYNLITYL